MLDRRTMLKGAGLAVMGGFGLPQSGGSHAATIEGEAMRDLPEVRSSGGVLDYRLDMAARLVRVGGRTINVDTYNGKLPGPILRFRPGDQVRLLLRNRMRPMGIPLNKPPPMCASQTMVATNIHTHGLQVPPTGSADNVFVRVDPLGQHQYVYAIPDEQPAGLHWYHPHFHGSTSHQAWAGLSGPMIVEGDIDQVPEIADMRERTMVINELWLDDRGEVPTALVLPSAGKVPFTSIPAVPTTTTFTLNGQLLPELRMRPGETQRWRVLNASPHRAIWLHVGDHALPQIGQDGVPFARTKPVPSIMLTSGNRAEFVVQAPEPGRYPVLALEYDQGHPGGARPTVQLGTLVVDGPPARGRVPTTLVAPPPVARRRTLVFSGDVSGEHGIGVRFFIDGRLYHHDRIDQHVEAGIVEEWQLVNDDVFQHPFHIHVNPFQVIDVQGIPPGDPSWETDPRIWWDVFRLPPKGEVTIRTYFRPDEVGKTVYHCHILPHEDNGMMGNVLISPPGEGS